MILATGQRLADHLDQYRCILHGGALPAYIGRPIQAALKKADQQLQRRAVISAILDIIDPTGCQSLWRNAKRIESAIARLDGVSLRRIQSGHRPASELEALLMELLELPGPQTHEKLFQELRKLASRSE